MNMTAASSTDLRNLNWNRAWREARQKRKHIRSDNTAWNQRAASFAKHTKTSGYARNFLRFMNPEPNWSVLDIGCGPGTLAVPLSGLVRSVTAIDFSDAMISILDKRCWEEGVTNIATLVLGWEDDWEPSGIRKHDVAIASRSLVVEDIEAAVIKLDCMARQKVFITSLVGDGPCDRRIFEAIGRDLDRGPDYVYVYNILNQMGILADITFVANGENNTPYANIDEAVKGLHWMIRDMTETEESRLRTYLEKHLVRSGEGWVLSYKNPVRWAVISWKKPPVKNNSLQSMAPATKENRRSSPVHAADNIRRPARGIATNTRAMFLS
jgi:SAM-dependent methyltransferase